MNLMYDVKYPGVRYLGVKCAFLSPLGIDNLRKSRMDFEVEMNSFGFV
jgi:hypothetical protein